MNDTPNCLHTNLPDCSLQIAQAVIIFIGSLQDITVSHAVQAQLLCACIRTFKEVQHIVMHIS